MTDHLTPDPKPLRICLIVATRRRPRMLAACMRSIAQITLPEQVDPVFVIIENDTESSLRGVMDDVAAVLPGPVHYALEETPGIPFARNRGLKEALALGADVATYVDDDEVVDRQWLLALVDAYRKTGAMLIGGPAHLLPPDPGFGWWRKLAHEGLEQRQKLRARVNARKMKTDRPPAVITSNWFCDLRVQRDYGIWFDEALQFTGGSDVKFFRDVRSAGLPTGWISDAIVYEEMSEERLSFAYIYRRARDQSSRAMRDYVERRGHTRSIVRLVASIPATAIKILGLAVLTPVRPAYGIVMLVWETGRFFGRFLGYGGYESGLYKQITGH